MKILFTGGGTGGHFYPLIAIAEALQQESEKEKILDLKLYYMSDSPFEKDALRENHITFVQISAGKQRIYPSLKNFTDIFKIITGIVQAIIKMYFIYPDVVMSKGGYASFPALVAARILHIPVVIHESDSYPGRVNLWSRKFAKRIGVTYEESVRFFKKNITAVVGMPIRLDLLESVGTGAHEFLHLESTVPTIIVVGGSLGSEKINDAIVDALPILLPHYQIIHQVGKSREIEVTTHAKIVVGEPALLRRYKVFEYFNPLVTKMCAGAADLYISRAGATSIAEIANWGIPSILIPIPESNSHADHQRKNAYHYAHAGAAVVIEEKNLSTAILAGEINRILVDPQLRASMSDSAKQLARPDASLKMAKILLEIALSHEK
ncbi:MAG: UDP-N-acetylglucosamine--N-acetylmuramyl-(pentapeptide) pyrophosphoryl-undecaprenol N-acetylglucosamine transferase [Candidatus Pacebacteria bacterium]|nr:UDP-N-acetylglucosamine--N-acetylmuramyl-(pentapeptide) pyrophosphoryl-undecaprenol N-acetylglucosamine transferase [Candidatus Paceibacterota bacterium]